MDILFLIYTNILRVKADVIHHAQADLILSNNI